MTITPSMSMKELGDHEYDDGELYPLTPTNALGRAITSERWLNVAPACQSYWLAEISSPRVKFVGTVLSRVRQQVELHVIYYDRSGNTGHQRSFCITLENFGRFLA